MASFCETRLEYIVYIETVKQIENDTDQMSTALLASVPIVIRAGLKATCFYDNNPNHFRLRPQMKAVHKHTINAHIVILFCLKQKITFILNMSWDRQPGLTIWCMQNLRIVPALCIEFPYSHLRVYTTIFHQCAQVALGWLHLWSIQTP